MISRAHNDCNTVPLSIGRFTGTCAALSEAGKNKHGDQENMENNLEESNERSPYVETAVSTIYNAILEQSGW